MQSSAAADKNALCRYRPYLLFHPQNGSKVDHRNNQLHLTMLGCGRGIHRADDDFALSSGLNVWASRRPPAAAQQAHLADGRLHLPAAGRPQPSSDGQSDSWAARQRCKAQE
jgi:hypothetical protein